MSLSFCAVRKWINQQIAFNFSEERQVTFFSFQSPSTMHFILLSHWRASEEKLINLGFFHARKWTNALGFAAKWAFLLMYANIIFCRVLMEPAFVYFRAETSFSSFFTCGHLFKMLVLNFIWVHPRAVKAVSVRRGKQPSYKLECSKGVRARRQRERQRKGLEKNKAKRGRGGKWEWDSNVEFCGAY